MNINEHLKDRHVDLAVHSVWIDSFEGVATFPVYNLSRQIVGYQQYRPTANKKKNNHAKEGRYFTHITKPLLGVWGLEAWRFSKTLFITEGVFCAARLTERGVSAIATLSNNPKHLHDFLLFARSSRPVVAICDYGSAGNELAKFAHSKIVMSEKYDLGDAPEVIVNEICRSRFI